MPDKPDDVRPPTAQPGGPTPGGRGGQPHAVASDPPRPPGPLRDLIERVQQVAAELDQAGDGDE